MSKALATKNVAAVALALAMVFGFAFAFAKPAHADALSDLQAQVQALLAQIASLQGGSSTTGGACFTFTQTLTVGSKGAEVMQLQKFLNNHGFTVAATGAGSPGNETSTFGPATKAAVMKFQAGNGVSPAAGYWGAISRAKANSLCAGTTTTTTTTTTTAGGNLVIAAGSQPANSLAPQGASRVPFTTFTLTNTSNAAVTVNGVTVQRTGLAQDAVFSGVVLVDSNNIQVGTSKTFNSLHQTTVGDTFVVQPGQTLTLTVAGNMAASLASYAGQVAGITVTGVNVVSGTVGGSLPISGAMQTINATLSLGSVSTTTSAFDPGTATTKNIGDTGIKFSGVKFTAGSTEDIKLYSIRWRQVGSVSSSDLTNVVTIVNGTSYPTTVDSTGKYYSTTFPGGLLIAKGNSIDIYVQGDVVGSNASSRTVDFDLDKVTDVYFVGQLYGYGIAPSGTYTPWYNGYVVTLSGASVTTIGKDTSAANAAQNIAINVANQPLGGFVIDLKGEAISVQSQVFTIATSSASTGLLTNVSLVDSNGVVVAGPVDATWSSGSMIVTFTDTVTYPLGRKVYSLKGKIPSGAGNGATVAISTTPSSNWTNITGQTTGNSVTISNGAFTMNSMTVKAGALAVTISGTPVAQSIIAGAQTFTFANVQLDASQSGEDVRINSIALTENGSTNGTAGAYNLLSTCQLYDGATALNGGSSVVNPSASATSTAKTATYTLDNSLTIAKGTVKTLAVKCNVATTALTGDTFQWGIATAQITALSVTGVTSGSTITATGTAANGSLMTVSTTGTLTATAASTAVSQPALALVPAGTTGVIMGSVKFHATNEDIQIQKIGLTLANGTYGLNSTGSGGSSSSGVNNVATAYIYAPGITSPVGQVIFTGATATSTLSTPVNVASNGDVTLTIKVDLANIGTSLPGGIGDTVKVDPLNAQGIGSSSGTQVNISATAGVNGVQMFKSVPTVTNNNVSCSSSSNPVCNGTTQVLKSLTVAANALGSVNVEQLKFFVSTTSANVTNILVQVLDNNGNIATSTFGATQCASGCTAGQSAGTSAVVLTGGPVIVPAGLAYTFKVLGDVAPSAATWSVNTKIKGDGAAIAGIGSSPLQIGTTTAVANADTNSNFIWSDNATTTASLTNVDWFNGNQVNGLNGSAGF